MRRALLILIYAIHEVDDAGGRPFIVMEYVEGRSLQQVIRDSRLALADQLRIGAQIADALDHAHQRGVIHRDLKSANVVSLRRVLRRSSISDCRRGCRMEASQRRRCRASWTRRRLRAR